MCAQKLYANFPPFHRIIPLKFDYASIVKIKSVATAKIWIVLYLIRLEYWFRARNNSLFILKIFKFKGHVILDWSYIICMIRFISTNQYVKKELADAWEFNFRFSGALIREFIDRLSYRLTSIPAQIVFVCVYLYIVIANIC